MEIGLKRHGRHNVNFYFLKHENRWDERRKRNLFEQCFVKQAQTWMSYISSHEFRPNWGHVTGMVWWLSGCSHKCARPAAPFLFIHNSSTTYPTLAHGLLHIFLAEGQNRHTHPHCKPCPPGKQFCMANTAILTSYVTFQSTVFIRKYFSQGKFELLNFLVCTFRQN